MSTTTPIPGSSRQVPNNRLNEIFGEINVLVHADRTEVTATILLEPNKEGSQTGVALDGSASMRSALGQGWVFAASYDAAVGSRMVAEGKATERMEDGRNVLQFTTEGWDVLQRLGHLVREPNVVEPMAREVIPYLAEKIDADGGTTVIYWACGERGDAIEVVGDLTADQARSANYEGPVAWGESTHLLPALRYFVERFADADWGFYVFVTDGCLDDLAAVKDYTAALAKKIAVGEAKPLKCVLIGVGSSVDEEQMTQLDDLPDELGLEVDIWDHKIAATMRDLRDIFAEVVDENAMVAPTGKVLDERGATVKTWSDGLPTKLAFTLPAGAKSFTLDVAGQLIEQPLN
ncbi:MAG: hypothetical protein WCN98_19865 [Verrucomicrobiaceae bacterium]